MPAIKEIHAREILDSRGNPTIEVDVLLSNDLKGRASVPSGASKGSFEAYEKRDDDPKRYHGKGVLKACQSIHNEIAPLLIGESPYNQALLDQKMIDLDGTENKSRLGANALLGVSLAIAQSAARCFNVPLFSYLGGMYERLLPRPMMNIINGGAHADNSIDIQEFMIIPTQNTISECIRAGSEIFHSLKSNLKQKGHNTNVGDEGGFAPQLKSTTEALDLLCEACEKAGYVVGKDVLFALDAASNEFYKDGLYYFEGKPHTTDDMITFYQELAHTYPICSIEDGLFEDDFEGWASLTKQFKEKFNGRIQLVGDDLFVTNPDRLQKGIAQEVANAILIKPNQIGTLTETRKTIEMAREAGYKTIISHRSGETEDTIIADLAAGLRISQIKAGSLSRTDRVSKYNQLLRIAESFGEHAKMYEFSL